MKFNLIEIPQLSGECCSIYSVQEEGEEYSSFERFLLDNNKKYSKEIKDIYNRLKFIGKEGGARYNFFKHDEGFPGDGVCALFDDPKKKLRLYCIRYGTVAVILGSGADKHTRTWQQDPKLKTEAEKIIQVSKIISQAIKNKDTKLSGNGFTELNFDDNE